MASSFSMHPRFQESLAMANKADRRELKFQNLAEVLAEIERLASGDVRTTGSHSFGQILNHLTLSQDVAVGRCEAPVPPLIIRLVMPLMKRMVINSKPLNPGVKLPASGESFFWPDKEFDVATAVSDFRASVEYYNSHSPLERHPFFGKITKAECDELNCRHAALHLSFVHPV